MPHVRSALRIALPVLVIGSLAGTGLWAIPPLLDQEPDPPVRAVDPRAAEPRAAELRADSLLGGLPLYFIENRGQADPRVEYYLHGSTGSAYFTRSGVTLAFAAPGRPDPPARSPEGLEQVPVDRWAVKLRFVGGRAVDPVGVDRSATRVSYFNGSPSSWHTGLPTYGRVAYRGPWPGIDVLFHGTGANLEYDFLVHPGADPSAIRLAYQGARGVSLDESGQLVVSTPVRTLIEGAPLAWQGAGATRTPVAASFSLVGSGGGFGFDLGAYDPSRPLLIDPTVLDYAGFIGGDLLDSGQAIAVDGAGSAYVVGTTASAQATFPDKVGPDRTFNGGFIDAFIAKVNPAGTGLVYAGYIGGDISDFGEGVDVDNQGNAYVVGSTCSTQPSFPTLVGPDVTANGGCDGFITKVKPTGARLAYSGFIGGAFFEGRLSVAVDGARNAYVGGRTQSSEDSFPDKVGPDRTFNGGEFDGFVAKITVSGNDFVYCGYIGGAGDDEVSSRRGIAVDGDGSAYVTGDTDSRQGTFPDKVGPDRTFNGDDDAFVAKVNATGSALVYAGYIGGAAEDSGDSIAVDRNGAAYVVGATDSLQGTFPERVGPDLTHNGGGDDAFVAKVNPAGAALVYAGFIGGGRDDEGGGIAVDRNGSAYVTGDTESGQATFPDKSGPDRTFNGDEDAFVARINAAGTGLVYAGYIGGDGDDEGQDIAIDADGNAYVTGDTDSGQATFPDLVGPDRSANGGGDAFVAKVTQEP